MKITYYLEIVDSGIGDRSVFSGLWTPEPLIATLEAMFSNAAVYASHQAPHGTQPAS